MNEILIVVKGCPELGYKKGDKLSVVTITKEGHGMDSITFTLHHQSRKLYGQHASARMLRGEEFNLHAGNPVKRIRVRKTTYVQYNNQSTVQPLPN